MKRLILVILVLLIICFSGCSINKDKIKITKYEKGTIDVIKEKEINSKKDIKEFKKYIENMKVLDSEEMIDLALLNEIKIIYNNNIEIYIDLDSKEYCYYRNTDDKIYSLAHLPNGMINLVNKLLEEKGDL